jgi:hypothetical protein
MDAWGSALARNEDAGLVATEDGAGRFAMVYAAAKAAAGHVPGGAVAVEKTVFDNMVLIVMQSLWPGVFGDPMQEVVVPLPDGSYAMLPWDQTVGRVQAASARHREKLQLERAWTCRPAAIEQTLRPDHPALQRGTQVSPHVFGEWMSDVDAVWVVRANCDSGPGVFVISGHVEKDGVHDRILVATLLSKPA